MATRMTTLLYGDKPEADVEPGNRVDTVNGRPAAAPPPMRPAHTTQPHGRPFALRGVVLGLAAGSVVLVGLTIAMIALAWAGSITPGAQVALIVLGVMLAAAGIAYVASARPEHATR
jgi:hypothetical protein